MRIVKLKGMRQINGLHYAPDGWRLLAVGGYEVRSVDEARCVDVVAGAETMRVPLNASCYAVSPDLTRMAVGNSHTTGGHIPIPPVVTFDPTDPTWHEDESRWRAVLERIGTLTQVYNLAFANDGRRLAVAWSVEGRRGSRPSYHLAVRQIGRGKRVEVKTTPEEFVPTPQLFIPAGIVVDGGTDKVTTLTLLDVKTLRPKHTFELPSKQPCQMATSPDLNTLAVANAKSVLLLPPDLSAPRLTLAHPKQVNAVAFTPDGRRVLTTCTDKLVRVWDATTGQLVTSYDWNVGVTNAIAVALDGLTAAVSGQTGKVVLFDLDE